jgi:hypothetical protein
MSERLVVLVREAAPVGDVGGDEVVADCPYQCSTQLCGDDTAIGDEYGDDVPALDVVVSAIVGARLS